MCSARKLESTFLRKYLNAHSLTHSLIFSHKHWLGHSCSPIQSLNHYFLLTQTFTCSVTTSRWPPNVWFSMIRDAKDVRGLIELCGSVKRGDPNGVGGMLRGGMLPSGVTTFEPQRKCQLRWRLGWRERGRSRWHGSGWPVWSLTTQLVSSSRSLRL